MGGDDITEFFYILLRRIGFPYNEINLTRSYDWNVMEDLKNRLCTLAEVDFFFSFLMDDLTFNTF
jgi:actin-related protein 8